MVPRVLTPLGVIATVTDDGVPRFASLYADFPFTTESSMIGDTAQLHPRWRVASMGIRG
jgi:hypothetical protein